MEESLEFTARTPVPLDLTAFNKNAAIPYGLTPNHLYAAMTDFLDFLGFINLQLASKGIGRLETMMMPANFSSLVGEFLNNTLPKYCHTLVRNRYHNGHPDLLPAGHFSGDAVQHTNVGIEVKASRYWRGWQGHNAEAIWLLIFVFESNRPNDAERGIGPKPFQFRLVAGASLLTDDWVFSGRSAGSRRTITASVARSGYEKIIDNWIYRQV
ncbi:MAG: hypothetical protein SF029_25580 [bacterium]|nr:hypothetical protein [bacterium]